MAVILNEIAKLRKEIRDLEDSMSSKLNLTTIRVIQNEIDKLMEKIERLAPKGFVLADVKLKTSEYIKRACIFTVESGIGSEAFTDYNEAKEYLEENDEVYLQSEDEDFCDVIETDLIEEYKLYYGKVNDEKAENETANTEKSKIRLKLTRTYVWEYEPKKENYDKDMTIEEMAKFDAENPIITDYIPKDSYTDEAVTYEII
ncbi:hypothetical protein AAGG74_19055 [Bacillus mexicanus]|uniref:hypothetical protein n=1 Tax=Bacillus mexicanus TaxID=2834415 RepID=UPI003D206178